MFQIKLKTIGAGGTFQITCMLTMMNWHSYDICKRQCKQEEGLKGPIVAKLLHII